MNGSDIFVICIISVFVLYGIYCGFLSGIIHTATVFLSAVASLVCYPLICGMARNSALFDFLKNAVTEDLGLREFAAENTRQAQLMLIDGLPLPEMFREKLAVNNNSVIYDLLGVDNVVDYIGAFIANIVLNIIVSIVLFIICFTASRAVLAAFSVLKKTPVIRTVGRMGGALLGFAVAVVFIWALFAVMDAFVTQPFFSVLYDDIAQSKVAILLYNTDIIRLFMLKRMF